MFSIDVLTISQDLIDLENLDKTISVEANQNLDLGISRSRFPVTVRSDLPIYQYTFLAYLSELEYKLLLQLQLNQRYNKIGNYVPLNTVNILDQLFYTFSSDLSTKQGSSFCYIQSVELDEPIFLKEELRYLCNIEILEIQRL